MFYQRPPQPALVSSWAGDGPGRQDGRILAQIHAYFDDQPETLRDFPPNVNVMLVRNGGNFDFATKQWLFSERTGRLV